MGGRRPSTGAGGRPLIRAKVTFPQSRGTKLRSACLKHDEFLPDLAKPQVREHIMPHGADGIDGAMRVCPG